MLPPALILGCVGLGIVATVAVIWFDESSIAMFRSLLTGQSASSSFQRKYLAVYLCAMMADWLQGPFVYALYESYGFSRSDNASLFVAGFGSSFVFGTFIGSLADKLGRRKFATLYCVLYIISCLTKHVNSYSWLMLGRITGAISTSLLFSVFDAWLVSEHNSRGFEPDGLGETFGLAIFGNSLVAILAGQVGQLAADWQGLTHVGGQAAPVSEGVHYGGYVAPFDVSIVLLCVCTCLLALLWSENYGGSDASASSSDGNGFGKAFKIIQDQPLVLYCGVVCSLFEASMFIFVFNWTPCLMEPGLPNPPFGHIFSGFMIMCMLGSRVFGYLSQTYKIETIGFWMLIVAGSCHLVPLIFGNVIIRFFAFLVFEACVGVYFPMMGTLKGQIVPEDLRSTIYNVYRVPLNAIVVGVLVMKLDTATSFAFTTAMLGMCAMAQVKLRSLRAKEYEKVPTRTTAGAVELGRKEGANSLDAAQELEQGQLDAFFGDDDPSDGRI